MIIGLGQPGDVKALTHDGVWVADLMAGTIYSVAPLEGRYVGIGMGDREPVQIHTPATHRGADRHVAAGGSAA